MITNNISKKTTTHSRHNSYKFIDFAKIDNVDFIKEVVPPHGFEPRTY